MLESGSLRPRNLVVREHLTKDQATQAPAARGGWKELFRAPFLGRIIPPSIAILMSYGAQLSVLTPMPVIFVSMGHTLQGSLLYSMIIQTGSVLGAIAASTSPITSRARRC